MNWDLALPLTAAGSGAAWAQLAAWRAGHGRAVFTFRGLLGGAAAFGLAVSSYDAATLAGLEVRWESLAGGGAAAFLAAAAIGLVEEGAKLAGILLVVEPGFRRRAVFASAMGVGAGFSALEALLVLHGQTSAPAFARAALGPVAHALLAIPLALGVTGWLHRSGRRSPARAAGRVRAALLGWRDLAVALAVSAALHGGGDLALAIPRVGAIGYAAALALPAFLLVLVAKRNERVRSVGGP